MTIPWWNYFLIGIVALIIIKALFISYHYSVQMNSVYAPLINANIEVELNVTTAHLLVEKILNGDDINYDRVWEKYALAQWYITAILNGGEKDRQKIMPLKDKGLRFIVHNLQKRLLQFKNISKKRLSRKRVSGAGSIIDKQYNQILEVFLNEAEIVKNQLQFVMVKDLEEFRVIFTSLFVLALALGLVIIFNFYRLERFRVRDYKALQKINEKLQNEIEERRRIEFGLIDSKKRLEKLSSQIQEIREYEKTKISREIHDELGQILTGLKMELSCLEFESGSPNLIEKLKEMGRTIDSAINSVRRIASELRPQVLDTCGLLHALEWQGKDYQARTGIMCEVELPENPIKLDPQLSTTIFRICQETLSNIARNTHATKVRLSLEFKESGIRLTVSNDFQSFQVNPIYKPGSVGFWEMEEQVKLMGGNVHFNDFYLGGEQFVINIPINNKALECV